MGEVRELGDVEVAEAAQVGEEVAAPVEQEVSRDKETENEDDVAADDGTQTAMEATEAESLFADGTDELTVGFAEGADTITVKTSFTESKDGTKLRICKYGTGEKHLLIVGGLAEYSGRYGYEFNFFAKQGYQVTQVELRGHGKSEGVRLFVRSYDELVEDMQAGAETIPGDCTCLCHSNGGLTMAYATSIDKVPTNIKKIVYHNPNLRNNKAAFEARIVSWLPFDFTAPATVKLEDLSDSDDANRNYENDTLVPKTLHACYIKAMVRAQDMVFKTLGTKGKDIPCFFALGTGDKVSNSAKGMRWAEGQLQQLGDSKCGIKTYEGYKHEMIHGLHRDEILHDINQWLLL